MRAILEEPHGIWAFVQTADEQVCEFGHIGMTRTTPSLGGVYKRSRAAPAPRLLPHTGRRVPPDIFLRRKVDVEVKDRLTTRVGARPEFSRVVPR